MTTSATSTARKRQVSLLEDMATQIEDTIVRGSVWLMFQPLELAGLDRVLVQVTTPDRIQLVPVTIDELPARVGAAEAQALTEAHRLAAQHGFCVVYTPRRIVPGDGNVLVMRPLDNDVIELVVLSLAQLGDTDVLFASQAVSPGDVALREHLSSATKHPYQDDSSNNGGWPACRYR